MSFVDSLKKGLFGGEDDYDDQYIDDGPQMVNNNSGLGVGMDDAEEEPVEGAQKKNKVVNIHATTQLKVVLVKPERFEDASTIADHLNNKRTVVLNLESTSKDIARRLIDFLSGVAYAGEDETYIYEKDGGVKVGIYCLYNQLTYNAMSILSAQAQEKLVAASRDKIAAGLKSLEEAGADFTIACLHMGREGYYEPTDVQTELCRYTVDAGFNAVYCTHAHRLQPAEDYNGGVIFYGLGNFIFGGHTNPGNGTDPGAYDTGIAQLTLKRVGGEVTLDSYSFIPCSLSSTVGPDSTVLGPNTLNNYQPQPYTEGGDAWNRAMSMLNGTYEGANYQVDYGNVLTAMNG